MSSPLMAILSSLRTGGRPAPQGNPDRLQMLAQAKIAQRGGGGGGLGGGPVAPGGQRDVVPIPGPGGQARLPGGGLSPLPGGDARPRPGYGGSPVQMPSPMPNPGGIGSNPPLPGPGAGKPVMMPGPMPNPGGINQNPGLPNLGGLRRYQPRGYGRPAVPSVMGRE